VRQDSEKERLESEHESLDNEQVRQDGKKVRLEREHESLAVSR
jgi:hypothetical protein